MHHIGGDGTELEYMSMYKNWVNDDRIFFLEKLFFLANRENMEIMSRKIQKYNFVNFQDKRRNRFATFTYIVLYTITNFRRYNLILPIFHSNASILNQKHQFKIYEEVDECPIKSVMLVFSRYAFVRK